MVSPAGLVNAADISDGDRPKHFACSAPSSAVSARPPSWHGCRSRRPAGRDCSPSPRRRPSAPPDCESRTADVPSSSASSGGFMAWPCHARAVSASGSSAERSGRPVPPPREHPHRRGPARRSAFVAVPGRSGLPAFGGHPVSHVLQHPPDGRRRNAFISGDLLAGRIRPALPAPATPAGASHATAHTRAHPRRIGLPQAEKTEHGSTARGRVAPRERRPHARRVERRPRRTAAAPTLCLWRPRASVQMLSHPVVVAPSNISDQRSRRDSPMRFTTLLAIG